MADIVFLGVTVAFFGLSWLLVRCASGSRRHP